MIVAQAAYGWSPEELHFQFPHLALGQIHSALAYYWDHRDAFDRDIARRLAAVDEQQRQESVQGYREAYVARVLAAEAAIERGDGKQFDTVAALLADMDALADDE